MMAACANIDGMKVDLNIEELEEIGQWYSTCSSECLTSCTDVMFSLLDKLGLKASPMDTYVGELCDAEKRAAVAAYLNRHPELMEGD